MAVLTNGTIGGLITHLSSFVPINRIIFVDILSPINMLEDPIMVLCPNTTRLCVEIELTLI